MKSSPRDAAKEQSLQQEDAPEESQLGGAAEQEATRFVMLYIYDSEAKPLSFLYLQVVI